MGGLCKRLRYTPKNRLIRKLEDTPKFTKLVRTNLKKLNIQLRIIFIKQI